MSDEVPKPEGPKQPSPAVPISGNQKTKNLMIFVFVLACALVMIGYSLLYSSTGNTSAPSMASPSEE